VAYDPANPGSWDLRRIRAGAGRQLDECFGMMLRAVERGAELLVTIECVNQSILGDDKRYDFPAEGCEPMDGPLMLRFRTFCRRHRVYAVAGLLTTRGGRAYNSAVLFGPKGEIAGVFDKVHMPAGEEKSITPGHEFPVFKTKHGTVGMLVCWDMQYPESARILALKGVDLIALPTWGWELSYGPARAYENHVTVAAAMGVPFGAPIWDFCAPSCVVDNMGKIVAQGSMTRPGVVMADVDIRREAAPQYGAGATTGMSSMRQIRLSQRRPDLYGALLESEPPLARRYRIRQADVKSRGRGRTR